MEELPPDRDETAVLAESGPPTEAAAPDRDGKPTAAPLVEPTPSPRPTRPPLAGRTPDGLALHVERYVPIIVWAAAAEGVDPAVIAALMDVEGSGEDAVSHAGAVGLMQLMPDKLIEGDDPFDPATNVLRAAQLIRRLARSWNGDLAAMAGAYFGAVDGQGQITNDTDGNLNGVEYVTRFARAYERWAVALGQPVREVAIRPSIRPRPTAVSTIEPELSAVPEIDDGPERDRWYLHGEPPEPAIPPVYS